jgi:hypothetical protein
MTAYQNYLGGGMLGAIQSSNNFETALRKKDRKTSKHCGRHYKDTFTILQTMRVMSGRRRLSRKINSGQSQPTNLDIVSALVIIAKRQPQYTFIVRAKDWLNPRLYVIDAQDPYTGDTAVIEKSNYKVGWVIDENGEANFSF